MTIEELQAQLEEQANLHKEELEKQKQANEKLATNNEKLLSEKKNTAEKAKELESKYNDVSSKYADVDIDKYKEITELLEAQKDKKMLEEGSVEELRRRHFEKGQSSSEKEYIPKLEAKDAEIGQYQGTISQLKAELQEFRVYGKIKEALRNTGVTDASKIDAGFRLLLDKWDWNDDFNTLVGRDGENDIITDNGDPIDIEDYLKSGDFYNKYNFLLPESKGGGAKGASGGSSNGELNPWKEGSINFTQQSLISRSDPKKAEKLKRLAGVL